MSCDMPTCRIANRLPTTSRMYVITRKSDTTEQITKAAREKLVGILAWKACQKSILPEGSGSHASSGLVIPFISGHRQGCATECPGEQLFSVLPGIRSAVTERIASCEALTSTGQIPGLEYFRLSPNPVTGGEGFAEFSLTGRQPVQYLLYGVDGKLLAVSAPLELQGPNRLPLPELKRLPAGIYPIQFRIGRQSVTRRLVLY